MKQFFTFAAFFVILHVTATTTSALELPDLDGPDNFWECILEKVPGSSYTAEFRMRAAECRQEFPYNESFEKKSTYFFGLFGNKNASECVEKNTGNTPSKKARNAIAEACLRLYPNT